MSLAALVLAGTRPGGDPLAGTEGKAHKALIEIGGTPLLARVIAGLREGGASRVAVSCDEGPVADLARQLGAEVLPTARGPSGSVALALARLGAPLLVTTADHALLRGPWVQALVAGTPAGADLSLMLARRADVEAALPGSRRTWLRFADGGWSGCNLFYLASADSARALLAWEGIEADRKRPWRIAVRIGAGTLLAYLAGRLAAAEAIGRLGRRIGVQAALVPAPHGLAAVDVDKVQDLADIRGLLGEG